MVDAVHSGYKAAAQAVVFSGTQQLNSLADNEWTDLSDAIDNSVNKYLFADLRLVLASAIFVGADSIVEVYIVPSINDAAYPSWTGDIATDQQHNQQYFVGSFTTTGTTAAQDISLRNVALPPGLFKWGVRNKSGVAFAASGNFLYWRPWNWASQ